jgi:hypothetical protein
VARDDEGRPAALARCAQPAEVRADDRLPLARGALLLDDRELPLELRLHLRLLAVLRLRELRELVTPLGLDAAELPLDEGRRRAPSRLAALGGGGRGGRGGLGGGLEQRPVLRVAVRGAEQVHEGAVRHVVVAAHLPSGQARAQAWA